MANDLINFRLQNTDTSGNICKIIKGVTFLTYPVHFATITIIVTAAFKFFNGLVFAVPPA